MEPLCATLLATVLWGVFVVPLFLFVFQLTYYCISFWKNIDINFMLQEHPNNLNILFFSCSVMFWPPGTPSYIVKTLITPGRFCRNLIKQNNLGKNSKITFFNILYRFGLIIPSFRKYLKLLSCPVTKNVYHAPILNSERTNTIWFY